MLTCGQCLAWVTGCLTPRLPHVDSRPMSQGSQDTPSHFYCVHMVRIAHLGTSHCCRLLTSMSSFGQSHNREGKWGSDGKVAPRPPAPAGWHVCLFPVEFLFFPLEFHCEAQASLELSTVPPRTAVGFMAETALRIKKFTCRPI